MKKNKVKIGLDFDDVIADSHSLKSISAKSLFGVDIEPSRFRKEFVIDTGVLTHEQYLKAVKDVYLGKYPMSPVSGAIDKINLLIKEGYLLKIITNRSYEHGNLKIAEDWLNEYKLNISITGVIYGNSKAEASVGLDIFVDDDPAKLHQLVGVVPHLLFFCWPHNVHEKEPLGSTRVFSWDDIYKYINDNFS